MVALGVSPRTTTQTSEIVVIDLTATCYCSPRTPNHGYGGGCIGEEREKVDDGGGREDGVAGDDDDAVSGCADRRTGLSTDGYANFVRLNFI